MTLKELLEKLSPEQKIKIGSGTSYFYVGTVADVIENSTRIDRAIKQYWTEKARRQFIAVAKAAPTYNTYLLNAEKEWSKVGYADEKMPDVSYNGFLSAVNDYEKKLTERLKECRDVKHDQKKLEPLLSRKVKTHDRSISEREYKNIIVSGKENGAMWSADEAQLFPQIRFAQKEQSDDTNR